VPSVIFLHQDFNFDAVLRDRELSRQSSDQGRRQPIRFLFTMRGILLNRLIMKP
jgi:hypothetical protein